MTTFASAFRDHVTPALKKSIYIHSILVAIDCISFLEAHREVFSIARKHGAFHLSNAVLDALDEWIAVELLKAIDNVDPAVIEQSQIADAKCEAIWVMTT